MRMEGRWIGDLDILDHLELLNSTVEVAKWLSISQSSCSRRYRSFSDQCDLDFDRDSNQYRANKNLDVLADLRKASQGIRVRQGKMRVLRGWQLGRMTLNSFAAFGRELPSRPMCTMQVLTILEQRLVDFAVMGILECRNLITHSFEKLRFGKLPLGARLTCIPICQWNLELIASTDHPLLAKVELSSEDLAEYPSLALPVGTAPVLMSALNQHNLGTRPNNQISYNEDTWEGYANEGMGLSYAAPFLLAELQQHRSLKRLHYDLGITECLAIVGHRDVITDPCFAHHFKATYAEINKKISSASKRVRWLH